MRLSSRLALAHALLGEPGGEVYMFSVPCSCASVGASSMLSGVQCVDALDGASDAGMPGC